MSTTKVRPPRSRWQWTWVWDDSVFQKYGAQLPLVGRWWSGQHKRVLSGIDGLLLLVVVGDGRLVVPVDFAIRRPDSGGPGALCRDKLTWARVMLAERLAAFGRRGMALPAPLGVADSWFGNSKLMQHVRDAHRVPSVSRGESVLLLYLGRWAPAQRPQPARGPGVALASASVGGGCALRAAAGHESHLWSGRGAVVVVDEPGEGSFLSAVSGDRAERPTADPPMAQAELD